jgi:ABC-type transport system involved in multi-copper enzyme maturation permease subunit
MLTLLIMKEIRTNIFTYRFAVTFVLAFILLLAGVQVMDNQYGVARDNYSAIEETRLNQIAKYRSIDDPEKRLNELNKVGITSGRAPQPLSVLASGLEKEIPQEVHQGGWFSERPDPTRFENPFLRTLTVPDFSYIAGVVMSLLALMFSFDGICGEKESQTLKLMLSYATPRHSILLSKWIGGYLVLICPFLLATGTALLLLLMRGHADFGSEGWMRIGGMVFFSMLYLSLFFTAGLLISTLTYRAATALIVVLFVWAGWLLVIPNLSVIAAETFVAVPTHQQIEAEKVRISKEIELRLAALRRTMLNYGKEADQKQQELRDEGKRRRDELDEFFENKLAQQTTLCRSLSRLSPYPCYKYAMTEMAMTGPDAYTQFNKAEKRFRQAFQDYRKALWDKQRKKQLPADWLKPEELPHLEFFYPRLETSLDNCNTDMLILVMLNVIAFMGSFVFFLRYDAR